LKETGVRDTIDIICLIRILQGMAKLRHRQGFLVISCLMMACSAYAEPPNKSSKVPESPSLRDVCGEDPTRPDTKSGRQEKFELKKCDKSSRVSLKESTPALRESDYGALAGNPAAVNLFNGTGKLGEFLGISRDTGVQLGGLWIANGALGMSGRTAGDATYNNLLVADFQVDLEKFQDIDGASFAATFLQFDGGNTNSKAGVAVGFDGLTEGQAPLNRSELYQLWWRQTFLERSLIFRVGKSVPIADFGNVIKAIPIDRERSPPTVPAVSALLFTPVFINPTLLGVLPGYYNSAWGATGSFVPNDYYATLGFFDGSLARGRQTGIHAGPVFNAYYFSIGEVGKVWGGNYPGKIAFGGWGQSGSFCTDGKESDGSCNPIMPRVQHGAQGFYSLLTNRLLSVDWAGKPGAFIGYLQYGINNAQFTMVNQFVGGGISGFGLIPNRERDTFGLGFGVSYLNPLQSANDKSPHSTFHSTFSRSNEVVTQIYYQAHVFADIYLEPIISYVPHPADSSAIAVPSGTQTLSYPTSSSVMIELITLF